MFVKNRLRLAPQRGVSKAGNRTELAAGLLEAVKHDSKILVEETITGREIECAVLGRL